MFFMLEESKEIVLSNETILAGIEKMGNQISKDYGENEFIALCIMKGAMVFCGHLIDKISSPLHLDYMDVSRYGNELTGNSLLVKTEPSSNMENCKVLIIDDMIDEGETLLYVQNYCKEKGAAEIKTAVLLDKKHNRRIDASIPIDYCAFTIPDKFIFGFGIDCKGLYRNLPDIYALNS